jgi:uncharacterized protein (DUF1800 family)
MNLSKRVLQRVEQIPDPQAGHYDFAADIMRIVEELAEEWARKFDDTMWLPIEIHKAVYEVRQVASSKTGRVLPIVESKGQSVFPKELVDDD